MRIIFRFAAYAFGSAFLIGVLVLREVQFPGTLRLQVFRQPGDLLGTSEYSIVETLQLVLLIIALALCLAIGAAHRTQRPLAVMFSTIALACLIRELDYFLDVFVRDNVWQVLIAILTAVVGAYLLRRRRRLAIAWARIWPSPAVTMLFCGAVILVLFSNLIGHEAFWQTLLEEDYRRIAKLAMEELTELVGYTLWVAGAVEYLIEVRNLEGRVPPVGLAARLARVRKRGRRPKEKTK